MSERMEKRKKRKNRKIKKIDKRDTGDIINHSFSESSIFVLHRAEHRPREKKMFLKVN